MIIYNVTTKVSESIKSKWLNWLHEEHIPDMVNTGCFHSATVLRLLETDDSEGPTYAIQYQAESKAMYNQYLEKFAGIMRQKALEKWGDQFIAFHSLLQVIH
jgi:hypothetical protein